jgi:hypothetical protein
MRARPTDARGVGAHDQPRIEVFSEANPMRSARAPVTEGFTYAYDPAWRQVREPGADVAQVFALVAGAGLAVATMVLWLVLVPFNPIRIDYAALLVALLLVLVLHETVHAVAFSSGSRRDRRVEIAVRKYRPQLRYHGTLSRTHYLAVLLAPYAAISLGTIGLSAMYGWGSGDLALISLVNALVSGGDLVAALLVWEQVPGGAIVRRQGDAVIWKTSAGAVSAVAR